MNEPQSEMATNTHHVTIAEPPQQQPPDGATEDRAGLGHRRVYSAVEGSLAQECLLAGIDDKQPPIPAVNGAVVWNEMAQHRLSPPPQEPPASISKESPMTPAPLDSEPELDHTPTAGPATHAPWSQQRQTDSLELKKAISQAIRDVRDDDTNGEDTFNAQVIPMPAPSSRSAPRRLPSLTSSTRSVMSNYSEDDFTQEDEDLAGLVVRAGKPGVSSNVSIGALSEASGVSTSGYVSSASASQSTAPTGPVSALIGSALPHRTPRLRAATNVQRVTNGGQPPMVPSSSTTGVDEGLTLATVLRAVGDLKLHVDKSLAEMREQNRSDFNRVFVAMQNDAGKRALMEGRLHSQLLLQSETMVAMEVKLLRLEAKVERKEAMMRLRRPGSGLLLAGGGGGLGITSGLTIGTQPSITTTSPNTIDEEDGFETMEIQVSNPPSRGSIRGLTSRGGGPPGQNVVVSSGASLASAVTATSFLDGVEEHVHPADDGASGRSDDGDVEDEGDDIGEDVLDGSHSTPTQGSGRHFTNFGSILLNPITNSNASEQGTSTRATRGDYDGSSSLATSVTSATISSTVITATTRGGDSINPRSMSQLTADGVTNEEEVDHEDNDGEDSGVGDVTDSNMNSRRGRGRNLDSMLGLSPPSDVRTRSRSHSPLTVQSAATGSLEPMSIASASIGGSVLTTAAVATARSFRARRDAASRMGNDNRPLANRVVSFTSNEVFDITPPPQEISEAGDSITMPDELDNLSDVADTFENRARLWREEYEARLDAIHKRFSME